MLALILALALTPPADLTAINSAVNDEGTYQRDQRHAWAPLSEKGWVGDCKDFALEKRKELMADGYASSRLVIWLAQEHGTHAVLVVDRQWVLDSQHDAVEALGQQHAALTCPVVNLDQQTPRDNDLDRC